MILTPILTYFISIHQLGCKPTYPESENRRISISNLYALTCICAGVPYLYLFNISSLQFLQFLILPFIFFFFPLTFFFNWLRFHTLAKINIAFSTSAAVFVFSNILGRDIGLHMVYIAFMTISFVIFDYKLRIYSWALILACSGLYIVTEINNYTLLPFSAPVVTPLLIKYFNITSLLVTFITLFLCLRFYIKQNIETEEKLEDSNSELTKALQEALERKVMLEKLSQQAAFTTLSMGIAHEIRNPMMNLLSSSEILETEKNLSQSTQDFLELIKRNIFRILTITDSMLKYGRPSQQKLEPLNVKGILEEICSIVKGECKKNRIKLNIDCMPEILIYTDPILLHQILTNIAINGIQAMPNGGDLSIQSRLSSFRLEDNVNVSGICIVITDTGEGISEDILDKVYDPFFTTKYKGIGLGLSIVLKNIHSLGGKLTIDTHPNKGTHVNVYLPLKAPSE